MNENKVFVIGQYLHCIHRRRELLDIQVAMFFRNNEIVLKQQSKIPVYYIRTKLVLPLALCFNFNNETFSVVFYCKKTDLEKNA